MAVFGIPVTREDDALRATRAAVELREVVHGIGLEARIGVNTGPVVAGQGDTLVTGDAVNVAARLEQAAGAGEILLGPATFRLVRDAVETEHCALELKGKSSVVEAHRLLGLDPTAGGVARQLERPMVGRERERARLRADFDDAVVAGTCRLFTVIGPAGVGKSRLVADFLDDVAGVATIARGRALSYGEGITYFPLVEVLVQLGVDTDETIRSSPADTQLSTRALFERLAQERPLVVVLDDLHWAEPPLHDLVEHVADWSRDVPIFLLCIARPELLDTRPGWGGGKLNATSVLLEPLAADIAAELADSLLVGVELDPETRTRILATAEGNPLFLEELVTLARQTPEAVEIPPTIQAVLQARLDTLSEDERAVVDRGSIEGQVFHRGAVVSLATGSSTEDVSAQLQLLVRKELVRPERPQIDSEAAFRFRHLLIRDTAYEALPKAVRAELHEKFAAWLDAHAALVEQDELVGYHLEQTVRYRAELDPVEGRAGALPVRAAERLAVAGKRAIDRGDFHDAENLLGRAVALLPAGEARRRLLPDLVEVLGLVGDVEAALQLVDELRDGDERDHAQAMALRLLFDPSPATHMEELEAARDLMLEHGDALGAARCERAAGLAWWGLCQAHEALLAYKRSRELMRSAGSSAFEHETARSMQVAAYHAGQTAEEVASLLDDLEADPGTAGPLRLAAAAAARARLAFRRGSIAFDELEYAVGDEIALLRQTGSELGALWASEATYHMVWVAGDEEVERAYRAFAEEHERLGALAAPYLANVLALWARSLARIGDTAAAREMLARAQANTHPDDLSDEIVLALAEAHVAAAEGRAADARTALGMAHEAADGIVMTPLTDEVDYETARIEASFGNHDRARALLSGLIERAEGRGYQRFADRYRVDLDALDHSRPG